MGLTCTLYRATKEEIDGLIADPATVRSFIDAEEAGGPPVKTVRPKGLLGLILRLFPITITEVSSEPFEAEPATIMDRERSIDIEKGWHGLHFLFTGTADGGEEPACYLLRGGEDLDDEGQIRALRPGQVRQFAEYLSTLTPAGLTQGYDPERMKQLDIYPGRIWVRSASAEESPLAWLLECYSELHDFMSRAAAANDGVVIHTG
jgi:hypothetical protein